MKDFDVASLLGARVCIHYRFEDNQYGTVSSVSVVHASPVTKEAVQESIFEVLLDDGFSVRTARINFYPIRAAAKSANRPRNSTRKPPVGYSAPVPRKRRALSV